MDSGTAHGDEPITPGLLADLQAGLLDDATAAQLRSRTRTDPEATRILAALERVRHDLAALGADDTTAAAVPAGVTARIGAALQHAPPPAHSAVRPLSRLQLVAAVAGLCAVLAGIGVGVTVLTRTPERAASAGPTAEHITASRPKPAVPLSNPQIVALLTVRPDYGPLADPDRRASCLSGLGYPAATKVLGARPVDMTGKAAVVLVLPGDTPQALVALVVEPGCSSADTGLLAETTVGRP
jgi:hypothetical protein